LASNLCFLRLFLFLVVGWTSAHADGIQAKLSSLPSPLGDAHIRLLTPLSSISSTRGSEFQAVVIAPFKQSGRVLMPQGTIVSGTITSRKSVGLGIVHERAGLGIEFQEYALPDGRRFPLRARLRSIDNGREEVTPQGEIRGVLAANSPQQVIGGVWTRPTVTLFERSPLGLTGLCGRIWKGYSLGPIGAAGLFALKIALFRMPEPDIQLPVGTELSLTVLRVPEDAPDFDLPEPSEVAPEVAEFLLDQPAAVTRPDGRLVRDIINVALEGTSQEMVNAFHASGWHLAAPSTPKTWAEECGAFTAKRGYSTAPVSKLTYRDQPPEFIFEKSLNSVLMRHHVRVWRIREGGRDLWFGAATHDIGAGFDPHSFKFTHRIQPQVDRERNKIINDLTFSQCSEQAAFVERPDVARNNARTGIVTDGRIAVLPLRACEALPQTAGMDHPQPVGPAIARMARRVVLETRNYVERENAFFWTYRAIKWTMAARRSQTQSLLDDEN
jgi:hypothetical protein